jgi:hypothetical protein
MIHRRNATSAPPAGALDQPGGFAWWYLDLVDDHGDGLVIIFSWGLPFLPGLAHDARAGQPTPARARPALCFSLYEQGRCTAYLLQEHDAADAFTDLRSHFHIGGSDLRVRAIADGQVELRVRLDCPIPGSDQRLTGVIEARGPEVVAPEDDSTYEAHTWAPRLAGARGRAQLDIGGRALHIEGALYHDRNDASGPLHSHGIAGWWWGRLALPDRSLIWYQLQHHDGSLREMLLDVAPDGQARLAPAPGRLGPAQRLHVFGPKSPAHLDLTDADGQAHAFLIDRPIDDSPFYQRFRLRGAGGFGWLERVLPEATDPNWMRPLVRMRVHKVSGPNSIWLPLFNGPAESRLARLLGQAGPRQLEAR